MNLIANEFEEKFMHSNGINEIILHHQSKHRTFRHINKMKLHTNEIRSLKDLMAVVFLSAFISINFVEIRQGRSFYFFTVPSKSKQTIKNLMTGFNFSKMKIMICNECIIYKEALNVSV